MASKKTLKINQKGYKSLLSNNFKHKYYFSAFNSTRKQNEHFTTLCVDNGPSLQDFTTDAKTYCIGLPYPISSPTLPCADGKDYCLELLESKSRYQHTLHKFLVNYKKDRKWLTRQYAKKTKYASLPKYIIDLCRRTVKDPDPYFTGNYNWYYSGGALDCIDVCGTTYFLHPNAEHVLSLTNAEDPDKSTTVNCLPRIPIYSIKIYKNYSSSFATVRSKHTVSLLKFYEAKRNSAARIFTDTSKDIPYIDVKFHDDKIYSLDLDRNLTIVSLEATAEREELQLSAEGSPNDRFGQIECTDRDVVYLNRDSVQILDKQSLEGRSFVLDKGYFTCDDLCTFALSQADENYAFLCSVHNIFKLDLREMKVVKQWSHMLSSPPLMIKTRTFAEGEAVFVSTQNHSERILLCSNGCESNVVQMVPNNADTLNECNLTYSFHLRDYRGRLQSSVAGIHITEGVELVTCNYAGDIFKNRVTDEMVASTEAVQKLNDWLNLLPVTPTTLKVTNLREMSRAKSLFANVTNTAELARYTKENAKRVELLDEIDTEDIDMASIWNVHRTGLDTEDDFVPSMTPTHKVTEWLQSRNYDDAVHDEDSIFYE